MSSMPRTLPQPGFPLIASFFQWLDGDVGKRAVEKRAPAASAEPELPARLFPAPRLRPQFDQGAAAAGIDVARLMEKAATQAPDLSPLEWDDGTAANDDRISATPGEDAACDWDPQRRRIRERYLCARFPGVVRAVADLQRAEDVIKSARLYFEDGREDLALELLEMAIQDAPQEAATWLARLEILFLTRDAAAFVAVARDFRALHGEHAEWAEIARLGRAISPGEALFGACAGARAHEHYGPWPDLPNWIQAPWDLTAEVIASDFHRTVRGLAA